MKFDMSNNAVEEEIEAFVDQMCPAEYSAKIIFHHFTKRVVEAATDLEAEEIIIEFRSRMMKAMKEREEGRTNQLVTMFVDMASDRMSITRLEKRAEKVEEEGR
ncbi:hypothetical protein GOD82_27775 [Sinorhizobium medicae]|nr:hypothetical protein [Sinorhizobium medicae]